MDLKAQLVSWVENEEYQKVVELGESNPVLLSGDQDHLLLIAIAQFLSGQTAIEPKLSHGLSKLEKSRDLLATCIVAGNALRNRDTKQATNLFGSVSISVDRLQPALTHLQLSRSAQLRFTTISLAKQIQTLILTKSSQQDLIFKACELGITYAEEMVSGNDFIRFHNLSGLANKFYGHYSEAKKHLQIAWRKCLETNCTSYTSLAINLGLVDFELGELDSSMKYYQMAEDNVSDDNLPTRFYLLLQQAKILFQNKKTDDAKVILLGLVDMPIESVSLSNYLAMMSLLIKIYKREDKLKFLELYDTALKLAEEQGSSLSAITKSILQTIRLDYLEVMNGNNNYEVIEIISSMIRDLDIPFFTRNEVHFQLIVLLLGEYLQNRDEMIMRDIEAHFKAFQDQIEARGYPRFKAYLTIIEGAVNYYKVGLINDLHQKFDEAIVLCEEYEMKQMIDTIKEKRSEIFSGLQNLTEVEDRGVSGPDKISYEILEYLREISSVFNG